MMNQELAVEKKDLNILYEPVHIGSLHLKNRIVMAPMTRGFSPHGIPGANVVDYYRRRAENEVGLIITEGTLINHPAAAEGRHRPVIYGEKPLAGWAAVVAAVHAAGGKIIPQIWHVGMARQIGADNPHPEVLPVGPSGIDVATGKKVTEPLGLEEIEQIIQAYGDAAGQAKKLGFDGVEIHGAHGYLIDQFFWSKTNLRQDRYGGDAIKRTQFAVEVIEACLRAVGPDFPIIFRFSQWKLGDYKAKLADTPERLAAFLDPLVKAGVDIFHCSTRRYWEPEFEGSNLNLAGWTKKLTGKPTITVGSVGLDTNFIDFFTEGKGAAVSSVAPLLDRLEKKEFDLVAVGRALLADHAWAKKVHANEVDQLVAFTPDIESELY